MDLTAFVLDSTYIRDAFDSQTQLVESLALGNLEEPNFVQLENEIRHLQEDLLKELDMPVIGKVRIRKLPAGSLLRIRTSGIYIPHAMEGKVQW